jgi:hypothetical protein
MFRGIVASGPGGSTDAELKALVDVLKQREIKVGFEIGGARFGAGRCNLTEGLAYAKFEQAQVERWIKLGGEIHSVTTDHASVKGVRSTGAAGAPCVPAVSMSTRIDIVAHIFASWRKFLGPKVSLGFIDSLGFWDIEGPDGTNFTNTDPTQLNNITGWIPRLDDFTARLLAAGKKYNPTPAVPLIDHYQIDYGMAGVEFDTYKYGRQSQDAPLAVGGGGVNYGRILGAEMVMKRHGLKSGVILNAFPGQNSKTCLVSCGPSADPAAASHSAVVRALNFTRGYMALPGRQSQHAVLEQWQDYPTRTGPEAAKDTSMWMASQCAAVIKP